MAYANECNPLPIFSTSAFRSHELAVPGLEQSLGGSGVIPQCTYPTQGDQLECLKPGANIKEHRDENPNRESRLSVAWASKFRGGSLAARQELFPTVHNNAC